MWKKTWVKVMLTVLIIWVISVGYYYVQHRITIWEYTIDQKMDLEDVKVKIEEVRLIKDARSFQKYSDELLMLKLRGKISSNKALSNFDADVMKKNIKIDVIDEVGANHASGGRWKYEDGSNTVYFEVRGSLFPVNRLNNTLTIVVTNKMRNTTKQIIIKPEYTKKTYGFFNRKPIDTGWDLYQGVSGIDESVFNC